MQEVSGSIPLTSTKSRRWRPAAGYWTSKLFHAMSGF
jgi:hypothetical protein